MTGKKYYYLAFLSPLVLPVLIIAGEAIVELIAGWKVYSQLSGFLMLTVLFGGIPYLVFLGAFYWWAKDKIGKQIHYASYLAPIIYLLIFLPFLVTYILITDSSALVRDPSKLDSIFSLLISTDLWWAYYLYGKIALVVAYAYIILFNVGYWLLKMSRQIR